VVDLHVHTTASDGLCDPATLVRLAWDAGLRAIAVTDHDTMAGVSETVRAGSAIGLRVFCGTEITAVHDDKDVHVLGYGLDPSSVSFAGFLAGQRSDRIERVREMGRRLARLGKPIDVEPLLREAIENPDASVGRPSVARALVAAGHVPSVSAAFETLIGHGCPAFVPRNGSSPAGVVARIKAAGGVASLAHPGLWRRDDLIPGLAEGGLDAIEAYHSEHTADDTERYLAMAATLGLAVTGGSDFHGDPRQTHVVLGRVTLPEPHVARFEQLLDERGAAAEQRAADGG
jgi:predicted metal-dependent phosphoesterase TrpH